MEFEQPHSSEGRFKGRLAQQYENKERPPNYEEILKGFRKTKKEARTGEIHPDNYVKILEDLGQMALGEPVEGFRDYYQGWTNQHFVDLLIDLAKDTDYLP